MNIYLDTSALVKRYIIEAGSSEVQQWLAGAELAATSLVTRAEANAAIARAVRMGNISLATGEEAVKVLAAHWPRYVKTPVNEKTVGRAADLAWQLGLRGYDAVQLASAETLQDALGVAVVLLTYDRHLAEKGRQIGLEVWPVSVSDR